MGEYNVLKLPKVEVAPGATISMPVEVLVDVCGVPVAGIAITTGQE